VAKGKLRQTEEGLTKLKAIESQLNEEKLSFATFED